MEEYQRMVCQKKQMKIYIWEELKKHIAWIHENYRNRN